MKWCRFILLSNDNLEEFVYAASHDLQEPLRKIGIFSDGLKHELEGKLTSTQQNIFERILSSTLRMKALIDDLLAYSHISIKKETFTRVDLNEVVQEVLQDLDSQINEAGVIITIGKLPQIKGNRSQMQQLFQNLISNAIKYRKPNGTPTITIQCKKIASVDPLLSAFPAAEKMAYHVIEVIDNGIGFEQKYTEKIFQVFQRLHGHTEYQGTGIGLAIVQKVMAQHKGAIKAYSVPGKGTTFQMLLPVE